ncbi:hypothetical protein JZY06_06535 [Corynebacterium sp. CCM 8862]|uniref:Uncharacterized protein n=1 Tax=Corynebacterium mendelii TaxID=2765362 RepID=A0A939ITW5_9CORY|nr:hypothetical protein [Corynebacterium mendelii]
MADAIKASMQQTWWACDEFTVLPKEQFAGDAINADLLTKIAADLELTCHLDQEWDRYEIGAGDTLSAIIEEDPSGQLRIWWEMTIEDTEDFHDED